MARKMITKKKIKAGIRETSGNTEPMLNNWRQVRLQRKLEKVATLTTKLCLTQSYVGAHVTAKSRLFRKKIDKHVPMAILSNSRESLLMASSPFPSRDVPAQCEWGAAPAACRRLTAQHQWNV